MSARYWAAILAACALWLGVLAACQPTGHTRCDAFVGPLHHIEKNGWKINCAPPFDGTNDGTQANPLGWASKKDRTVYIWPNHIRSDKVLHKIMWHEAGHTAGYGEWLSEVFAWCNMQPRDRDVVSWSPRIPQRSDCWRVEM